MIDFTLSPEQSKARQAAKTFAEALLKDAHKLYSGLTTAEEKFQATKPFIQKATELGLVKLLIPAELGGAKSSESLIDGALAVEELYAVEPSITLTLLSNGLGLGPLVKGGTHDQHKTFLAPFLEGHAAPLASLTFSEPGGSVNYFEKGGLGMQTTATRDGHDWVLNGEKVRHRGIDSNDS